MLNDRGCLQSAFFSEFDINIVSYPASVAGMNFGIGGWR
jgi:hypothetical protein